MKEFVFRNERKSSLSSSLQLTLTHLLICRVGPAAFHLLNTDPPNRAVKHPLKQSPATCKY